LSSEKGFLYPHSLYAVGAFCNGQFNSLVYSPCSHSYTGSLNLMLSLSENLMGKIYKKFLKF
jgi:hypothetical protein